MTYPTISLADSLEIVERLSIHLSAAGTSAGIYGQNFEGFQSKIKARIGADFDERNLVAQAYSWTQVMVDHMRHGGTKAELEEYFAAHIVEQLAAVPDKALQDPDFWRYLTLFPYRQYMVMREGKNLSKGVYGGNGNTDMVRWTLIRGYRLGARTIVDGDTSILELYRRRRVEMLSSDNWVTDYLINNPIRRRFASWPSAARAFIKATVSGEPIFDLSNEDRPTNVYGGLVGRIAQNVYLPALTEDELEELFYNVKVASAGLLNHGAGLAEPDL